MFSLVLAHFVGDFILQSHYMAEHKLVSLRVCVLHVIFYTIPFCFLVSTDWKFLFWIAFTHLIVDFFKIAEKVTWLKNIFLNPKIWTFNRTESQRYNAFNCKFGYPIDVNPQLALTLLIVVDQILHIVINTLIFKYFNL